MSIIQVQTSWSTSLTHADTNRWTKPEIHGTIPICSFPVSFVIHHWIFFFGGQKITENYITNDLYYYDTGKFFVMPF
jgi:hypothetical protein